MWPPSIVEAQITTDRLAGFADPAVGAEVNLLIFHRAPQALDHHIVAPGAPAIHADGDFLAQQHAGEGVAGELASVVAARGARSFDPMRV